MNKYIFIIICLLSISGCRILPFYEKAWSHDIQNDKSYIAGRFDTFRHYIILKDLKTEERFSVRFDDSNEVEVVPIPEGDYAIVFISVPGSSSQGVWVHIPYSLMREIHIRRGMVTYIGRFEYSQNQFRIGFESPRYVYTDDIERARTKFFNAYKTKEGIRFVSAHSTPLE
jgi:hypothetical protein